MSDLQTSGLALACRLAEDPTITIAVLEAGGHNHELPVICEDYMLAF